MREKNANSSCGFRHHGWEDVHQTIELELGRNEAAFTEEQDAEKETLAQSSPPLYPLQYAID